MTPRDRQASGGATLTPRPGPSRNSGTTPAPAGKDLLCWEEYFPSLPSSTQAELLALAARQGFLHVRQLPDPALAQQRRQFLPQLLAGKIRELPPLEPADLQYLDSELDDFQREAVRRAVLTPDLCLIQGWPGSGKSRVVAEILRQAVLRGQRVLLLAPSASAVDRALELAGQHEMLFPIRWTAPGETVASFVRALTFEERLRQLRETCLQKALARVQNAERLAGQGQSESDGWQRLGQLLDELESLAWAKTRCQTERDCVAEVIRAAADNESPEGPLKSALADLEKELDSLRQRRQALSSEQTPLQAELASLRPDVEARRAGRIFSLGYWKLVFRPARLTRHEELTRRLEQLTADAADLDGQLRKKTEEAEQLRQRCAAARQQWIEEKTQRRQEQIDAELDTLQQRICSLEAEWDQLAGKLTHQAARPRERSRTALAAARQAWEEWRREAEEHLDFIRRWAEGLRDASEGLSDQLVGLANVVGSTLAGLASCPHLAEGRGEADFDLLILEEAEQVTESDFLAAARRARRWVLVGEPTPNEPAHRRPGPARAARPGGLRPGFFARLWQQLHVAPSSLPYGWSRHEGRLCCRLRPVEPEQRRWLECEPVADCPEIELGILTPPRGEPVLAEVTFPPATTIQAAKDFIFRELEEVPAHCRGRSLAWCQTEQYLRLQLCEGDWPGEQEQIAVALDSGVTEIVHAGEGCETAGFLFDRGQGWDRARAEQWCVARLGFRDSGRTLFLSRLVRMSPDLRDFIAEVVLDEAVSRPVRQAAHFVAVPDPESRRSSRPAGRGRGGAGFELDLADTSHPEALPPGLRGELPATGLVNYCEARAVVQGLEDLLSDPASRAELLNSGPSACTCPAEAGCAGPAVLVTALYPAQVQLLRSLVGRSRELAGAGLKPIAAGRYRIDGGPEVWIDVPTALAQRDCHTLLLSLTRSHTHRAVPWGDDPRWLPLALTRPRRRLFLFGDPGTLHRRTQWPGALDHLDEQSAAREAELLARLLRAAGLPASRPEPAIAGQQGNA